MKVSKNDALKLIDEKIDKFSRILDRANNSNMYDQEYKEIYYGTESVIRDLYSKEESMDFRRNVGSGAIVSGRSDFQKLQDYKKHIESCISQLNVYKSKVQNFWGKETIINWSVVKSRLQPLVIILEKFKVLIGLLIVALGVIAKFIVDWQTVFEFINSTFK
ncbi:MAG: hypothetical protein KAJ19_29655 [Gammaproteobacteria bacterium]|nr:hypothetical protein [Gammaproteobacteria bacterium]